MGSLFLSPNFYRDCRPVQQDGEPLSLSLSDAEPAERPPERLLQEVWYHQRLQRGALTALDGRPVRILHPGFWNHESGPDFVNAMVQFGEERPLSGDVEIDLDAQNWSAHGHQGNPSYGKVILHVIWEAPATPNTELPTLALKGRLDSPLGELKDGLHTEMPFLPEAILGRCCEPLRNVPTELQVELIQQAAAVRLEAKARRLEARARQVGWHQSLWEGLLSALGYKQNVWPMRRMGELLPTLKRGHPDSPPRSLVAWQARLLGVANLLPSEPTRRKAENDDYLRLLWSFWWREREAWRPWILPRELWHFSGIRPANHPERRLALVAHWVTQKDLVRKLERWMTHNKAAHRWLPTLMTLLQGDSDEFWSWHWTLRSTRQRESQPLLGPQRTTDIAMNILLPWFWIRAKHSQNTELLHAIEHRYFQWPLSEENALLRLARKRLLGGRQSPLPRRAAMQQGLLQILRDFCEHSNALCENCHFPDLVRQLGSSSAKRRSESG